MKRPYTIMILPHARPRMRRIRVSGPFLVVAATVLAVLAVAGLFTVPLWVSGRAQSDDLARLSVEADRLRAERATFESELGTVTARLERFESTARTIAGELDLELPDVPAAGGAIDLPGGVPRLPFQGELSALQARSETLDASFERLDEAFRERSRVLASTPDRMPVGGWFSHGYGWRTDPFTSRREFHRGVDIVAERGSPIASTADGIVSRAGRNGGYGKSIDISHGYGFVTRYAHLDEILVQPGDEIRRGELIGRVGSTGRSTGPHLHYEVFRDGRRVNPWRYLGR